MKKDTSILVNTRFKASNIDEDGQFVKDVVYFNHLQQLDTIKTKRILAFKQFELSNHLGNVLATILDRRTLFDTSIYNSGNDTAALWDADIVSAQDYYPFGMLLPDRIYTADSIGSGGSRFGFNGMERDDEWNGAGNAYDFGARMYDARIAQFRSIDPLFYKYPSHGDYVSFMDNPILFIDPTGKGAKVVEAFDENGEPYLKVTAVIYVYNDDVGNLDQVAQNVESQIESIWNGEVMTMDGGKEPQATSQYLTKGGTKFSLPVVFDVEVHAVTEDQAKQLASNNTRSDVNFMKVYHGDSKDDDGGSRTEGNSAILDLDVNKDNNGRDAAHEFGHLMGYRYLKKKISQDGEVVIYPKTHYEGEQKTIPGQPNKIPLMSHGKGADTSIIRSENQTLTDVDIRGLNHGRGLAAAAYDNNGTTGDPNTNEIHD